LTALIRYEQSVESCHDFFFGQEEGAAMITTHHEPKNASLAILGATLLDGTGQ